MISKEATRFRPSFAYKFTGQPRGAATGLDNFPFRYHSSTLGRWLTPDPAGNLVASPANPQSWNQYAYVLNNPATLVDPFGLFGTDPDPALCSTSAGTVVCPGTVINVTGGSEDNGFDPPYVYIGPHNNSSSSGVGGGSRYFGLSINRSFSKDFQCASPASQVMAALENNFASFADTTGGATYTIFSPGPVMTGQMINIDVGLEAFGHAIAYKDVSVVVQSAGEYSLMFRSTSTHVLYPATVTFSAADIGHGRINFTTSVHAMTNGLFGTAAFIFGGRAGETSTWNNLLNNVEKFCRQ